MNKAKSITETVRHSDAHSRWTLRRQVCSNAGEGWEDCQKRICSSSGAVVILPILDEKHIVMIRNQRFAVNAELWELPAGTLEPNEAPDATAARELIEETGYEAARVEKLIDFFTTPGICNEIMYAYVAHNLKHVGQKLEETEQIKVEVVEWDKAMALVRDGVVCDAKSLTTLMYYRMFGR